MVEEALLLACVPLGHFFVMEGLMLSPGSFRKAASILAGASMALTAFSASAQQAQLPVNPATLPTCSSIHGPTDAGVRCAIRRLDQNIEYNKARGAAADARGAAADARASAAEASTKCMEGILSEIETAKKKAPLSPRMKLEFKARIDACDKV